MWGFALVLVGIVMAGAGVRVALGRPRPLNLAGMLLATAGLCVALLGVGRVLSPSFFGRDARAAKLLPTLLIMPAGDSLTRGTLEWPKDDPGGGYRGRLWAKLAGRPVDFVGAARSGPFAIDRDHEGWSGFTIDELGARLLADLPAYQPDVILLHIGTNDIVKGASPDQVVGRLGALVDAIVARAPRAYLLVASLAGIRPDNRWRVQPETMVAVNALIRAAITQRIARGDKVRFVDMHARTGQNAADFIGDGLHLSARGYGRMADAWFEALRPLLPPETAPHEQR